MLFNMFTAQKKLAASKKHCTVKLLFHLWVKLYQMSNFELLWYFPLTTCVHWLDYFNMLFFKPLYDSGFFTKSNRNIIWNYLRNKIQFILLQTSLFPFSYFQEAYLLGHVRFKQPHSLQKLSYFLFLCHKIVGPCICLSCVLDAYQPMQYKRKRINSA